MKKYIALLAIITLVPISSIANAKASSERNYKLAEEVTTIKLSKYKTAFQLTIIILTLIFLTLESFNMESFIPTIDLIKQYKIIYMLTLFTAIFTAYTGIIYLYANRFVIKDFIRNN